MDFQWIDRYGVVIHGLGISPDPVSPVQLIESYRFLILPGQQDKIVADWRRHYRRCMQSSVFQEPVCLSNTWGDRNRDTALNNTFIEKEFEAIKAAGLGGIMLDDGWQSGITANSGLKSDFWVVNPAKFPDGMAPLVQRTREMGKEVALWFSPDSSADFANWEKDAAILLNYYVEYGIRIFKLDGIKLRNRTAENRFGRLLDKLQDESDGSIFPILDITSGIFSRN